MCSTIHLAVFAAAVGVVIYTTGIAYEDHEVLRRTGGKGEELSPSFRGLPGENFFRSSRGLWIHYRERIPHEGVHSRALVFVLHGSVDHSGWYVDLLESLSAKGFAAFAHDSQGRGLSEGDRGYARDFLDLAGETAEFVALTKQRFPGVPAVCVGKSIGSISVGIASARTGEDGKPLCDAVAFVGVALQSVAEAVSPLMLRISGVVSRFVPHIALVSPIDPKLIAHDEATVQRFHSDPVCFHGRLPTRFGRSFLDALGIFTDTIAKMKQPLLLIHGADDAITPMGSAESVLRTAVSTSSKKLIVYDHAMHNVFQEPGAKEKATEDLIEWIDTTVIPAHDNTPFASTPNN